MMPDKRSKILIIIGLLLVSAALFLTVYNVWNDAKANNISVETLEDIMKDMTHGKGNAPKGEMPVKNIDGIDYVAVISLPSLGLELPVAATWDYKLLKISPCRYVGSAYNNDLVICAHNYESHFGKLKGLSIGDEIVLVDMDGNIFNYKVAELETLIPTAVNAMVESDYDLSLFTCTIGGRTRVTVRCDRVY